MTKVKIGNVYPSDEYLLARCAPIGYGLGAAAKLLTSKDDLNTIKANGWYYWNDNNKPANVPTTENTNYLQAMRVWTTAGGTCYQELVDMVGSVYQGCKMQRTIYGNNVYEWEWVNPPMMAGIEYRTTERRQGKAVYTKLVDCGAIPNAESKIVAHNCAAIMMIRCCGTTNLGTTIPYRWNDSYTAVSADRTNIHLCTNADFSGQTCMVQLWYTKD